MLNLEQIVETTAVKLKDYFTHFGIYAPMATLWGHKPEEVINLKFKVSKDQSLPVEETNNPKADY